MEGLTDDAGAIKSEETVEQPTKVGLKNSILNTHLLEVQDI